MTIKVSYKTMNRIMELVRPLSGTAEAYLKIDFGTGKSGQGEQVMMDNKVSLTNGTEQIEAGFRTSIPQEVEKPLEQCNILSPLESCVFKASEFVSVVDVLCSYEQDLSIETDSAKAIIAIDGVAEFPVYKTDANNMKALIPHRNNSPSYELHDADVMTLRFVSKEFTDTVKGCAPIAKKIGVEALRYYRFIAKDIPLETVTVEEDGVSKTMPRYNMAVQAIVTNQNSFVSESCKCFAHKGSGNDLVQRVSAAKDVENPVISFTKEGDEVKPVVIPFTEYFKKYSEERKINGEGFQFGIPVDVMDAIVKLAGTDAEDYVDITIGMKYIQIFMRRIGFIYTAPQRSLIGAPDFTAAARSLSEMTGREGSYMEFDSKELSNTMKLMSLYDKDALISRMPLTLEFTEEGISIKRGEAKANIKALKADIKEEHVLYGMDQSYIPCIISAIPAGTFRVTYGIKKSCMAFTKGDVRPDADSNVIIIGAVDDIEKRINEIKDSFEKEQEAKAKKEAEKKNK